MDFKPLSIVDLHVDVTRTLRLELHLELATVVQRTSVSSNLPMVQLDTSALGRTVSENQMLGLPLVTRNFSQIAGLSPWRGNRSLQRRRARNRGNRALTNRAIQ